MHRPDDANIIDMFRHMRKQFAHFDPALTAGLKRIRRFEGGAGAAFRFQIIHRQRFAMELRKARFGIESIDVRRSSIGEDVDHAPGFSRKMRISRRERGRADGGLRGVNAADELRPKQLRQPEHAESDAAPRQKVAPGQEMVLESRLMMQGCHFSAVV